MSDQAEDAERVGKVSKVVCVGVCFIEAQTDTERQKRKYSSIETKREREKPDGMMEQ